MGTLGTIKSVAPAGHMIPTSTDTKAFSLGINTSFGDMPEAIDHNEAGACPSRSVATFPEKETVSRTNQNSE